MAQGRSTVSTTVESGHEFTPKKVEIDQRQRHELALWWKTPRKERGKVSTGDPTEKALFSLMDHLKTEQKPRLDRIERHMRLYGGRNFMRLDAKNYQKNDPVNMEGVVAFNGIQSVVDTVMSKVAKNKPVPQFLTEGGNFEERIRAKKLSRYVSGVFYDQKVYDQSIYVSASAGIIGTGMFYPFRAGNRVKIEWVFPNEVFVDDVEAHKGAPGNVYREKQVPRHVLLDLFPEHEEKILAAQTSEDTQGNNTVDQVRVVEAWHLASAPGKEDGRHVIAIETETLEDDVYRRTYDPFVRLHWQRPLLGWWGRGLPEELVGLQVETNRLLIKIQKTFHLAAVPWVLLPTGSQVSTADIRNQIGLIIRYAGNIKPDIKTHQTVSPEVFNHLERLMRLMFEKAGVSQMAATARKPAGLESGIALREYNDIGDERLILFGQAHEQMFLELARRVVDLSREIAETTSEKEGHGKLKVRAPRRRDFETIAWDQVDLADERYVMQVFPISSLPSSPAGRKDEVLDLMNNGLIPPSVGMALLDYPDLQAEQNLQLAAIENIDWTICEMLEEGHYHPPEPFQDLQLGLQRVNAAYLMAKTDGAPEERLALLRRWMMSAQTRLAQIAAAQQPPPAEAAPAQGQMQPQAQPASQQQPPGMGAAA